MSAHRHRHHHHHHAAPQPQPQYDPDGLLEPDWGDAPASAPAVAEGVDPDMLAMARASGLGAEEMANLEGGKHEAVTELMIPYAD